MDTTARKASASDQTNIDLKHIDVLDGVRALAVFGVLLLIEASLNGQHIAMLGFMHI